MSEKNAVCLPKQIPLKVGLQESWKWTLSGIGMAGQGGIALN